MSFGDDEGWFWYWWNEELEDAESKEGDSEDYEEQSSVNHRSTYKRIKVTEDNENILCAQCGMPLGEQGKTALVKITPLTGHILLDEREYFCEKCKPKQI